MWLWFRSLFFEHFFYVMWENFEWTKWVKQFEWPGEVECRVQCSTHSTIVKNEQLRSFVDVSWYILHTIKKVTYFHFSSFHFVAVSSFFSPFIFELWQFSCVFVHFQCGYLCVSKSLCWRSHRFQSTSAIIWINKIRVHLHFKSFFLSLSTSSIEEFKFLFVYGSFGFLFVVLRQTR